MLFAACKADKLILGKNEKGSYYALYKNKTADMGMAVIAGRVRTPNKDKSISQVIINGTVYQADSLGYYNIKLPPGKYKIEGWSTFYNPMKLEPMTLKGGDSLVIDFMVTLNTDPVCELEN